MKLRSTLGVGLVGLAVGASVAWPAGAAAQSTPTAQPTQQATQSAARTVAVFGDSITESDSSDADGQAGTTFGGPGATVGQGSWAKSLESSGTRIVGYAKGGATTTDIAAHVTPTPAADKAIIMAGSNDLASGRSVTETLAGVRLIAQKTGLPPEKIVIAAPPPNTPNAKALTAFHQAIPGFAAQHGYQSIEAPAALRAPDGQSLSPAMTTDGVHLNTQGAGMAGQAIAAGLSGTQAPTPRAVPTLSPDPSPSAMSALPGTDPTPTGTWRDAQPTPSAEQWPTASSTTSDSSGCTCPQATPAG